MGLNLRNLRIIRNKKTNQLLVALPRKRLRLKNKLNPKSMNVDNVDFEFE